MPVSLFAGWTAQSVRAVWQRKVSKGWTYGLAYCEMPWRKITAGSTKFWWTRKNTKKEKTDEQNDAEDGRRYACGCNEALRRVSGGGVPRAHRSGINSEMDARSRRLDNACLYQMSLIHI